MARKERDGKSLSSGDSSKHSSKQSSTELILEERQEVLDDAADTNEKTSEISEHASLNVQNEEKEIEISANYNEVRCADGDSTVTNEDISNYEDKSEDRKTDLEESRIALDILDSEPTTNLSIDNMERKQQSHKVQRDFAEALRDGRRKSGGKKKILSIDENSIVSRILGEVGNKSEPKKPASPKVVRLEESVKKSKEAESRREKTLSVCSDNIPDLCPIEEDEVQEDGVVVSESDDLDEDIDDGCTLSKKNFYKSGSIFFMTDFDDEDSEVEDEDEHKSHSDDDSFVDAEEHLTQEKSKLKPVIREILDSSLSESDLTSCGDASEVLEAMSSKLVFPISSLVMSIVKEELTSSSSQVIAGEVRPARESPEKEMEREGDRERESPSHTPAVTEEASADMERVHCDTVCDVFDLSMKRLDFIGNSFKTIYSDESQPPAIENKEDSLEEKMMKIKEILSCSSNSEEKIRQIESIMNIQHDHE